MYGNLKIIDNALWSALASETYDPDKHAFAPTLYRFNLAGNVSQTYTAPTGYGFHHDITTDEKGNLWLLGSLLDNWNDEQKLECVIYKYDIASGGYSGSAITLRSFWGPRCWIILIPTMYILIASSM